MESIGTWWVVCLSGMLIFTIWGLLISFTPLRRIYCLRAFPERRRDMYFSYVRRLVNEHHLKETAVLRAKLAASEREMVAMQVAMPDGAPSSAPPSPPPDEAGELGLLEPLEETSQRRAGRDARRLKAPPPSPPPSPSMDDDDDKLAQKTTATLAQRLYAEERINALIIKERSLMTNVIEIVKGIFREDPEAFYMPVRIACAFTLSLFSLIFMAVWFSSTMYRFRSRVIEADIATRIAMYASLTSLESSFHEATGSDLPAEAGQWLLANANMVQEYMVSLANAIYISSVVGSTISLAIYALVTLLMVADFRVQVTQARRGIWQFNEPKVAIKLSTTFIGTQISNALLIYLLFSFIITPIVLIFAWKLTWDVLIYVLASNLTSILILVAFALINPLIKLIATKIIVSKKYIIYRYCWAVFELWELLTQVAIGLGKSIVRFVLVIVSALLSLPRIDRSPFPAWIEYYLLLDSGSKSYQGVIVLYHVHNNPVMRVACWVLQEDSRDRRIKEVRASRDLATPRYRLCANKWQKALFLVKHPELIKFKNLGAGDKKSQKLLKTMAKKGVSMDEASARIITEVQKKEDKEKKMKEQAVDGSIAVTSATTESASPNLTASRV